MAHEIIVTMDKKSWPCTIQVLDHSKNYIKASIRYHGSEYMLCVMRYYHHSIFGSEYGLFVPDDDFGCKVSDEDTDYNDSQISKHTPCEINRRSEVAALLVILSLFD